MSDLIERARAFATKAHDGQTRKYTGEPYIVHPEAVAALVSQVTDDPEVIAAAWLHDVVEDCGVHIGEIAVEFGIGVARYVTEVTDVSRPEDGNRAYRKAMDRNHLRFAGPKGQTIKLADLIDNTKSIVERDPSFARIYLREKRDLLGVLTRGDRYLWTLANDALFAGTSVSDTMPDPMTREASEKGEI